MACNLQLQRASEVFFSTVDIAGGAAVGAMTPANTWKIEVLAGFAMAQAAATQDITTLESGTTPDRSGQRFMTAINPVEWNFQTYARPTGLESSAANADGTSATANVKPIAGWALMQAALSNAAPHNGTRETSAWQNGGKFDTAERSAAANVVAHRSNFSTVQENHLYFKLGNVVYQVSNASVNQMTMDAAIDAITSITYSGFGTNLIELTGTKRNNAVSVFGGVLNDGSTIAANSNALTITKAANYHPWDTYNVAGVAATASFIKNRLSTIDINFAPDGAGNSNYTFPVTALNWSYNNNMTYLTPEELGRLNTPIGNFAGTRDVSGSCTAYLRVGGQQSADLLRNIVNDRRTTHSDFANANLRLGGATAPFIAAYFPSVQFDIPSHQIEDVISVSVNFKAQEANTACGLGGEVAIFVKK